MESNNSMDSFEEDEVIAMFVLTFISHLDANKQYIKVWKKWFFFYKIF